MKNLIRFISSGGFSGYFPIAPGTFASLVMVGILFIFGVSNPITLSSIAIVLFISGVYVGNHIEKELGKDPSIVVIDEMAGMTLSLLFLPKKLLIWFIAFLLFRLFDIFKPFPVRRFESFKGGWGIMLDDIGAGIYTIVIMNLFVKIIL